MISYEYKFRVAYPDTDRMGTMHHANYVKYCELARWELLRNIGVPYAELEANGVMCPVISMQFKFIKTTHYDELITIATSLVKTKGVRMWFEYKFINSKGECINEAQTEIAFVGLNDWKPCAMPQLLSDAIKAQLA